MHLNFATLIFLFLVNILIDEVHSGCSFTYNFQITVEKNTTEYELYEDQDLKDEGDLTVTFDVGETITVKCVPGYQFVNGIRKINGVNTFKIDQAKGIEITCGTGDSMYPDISTDVLGNTRYLFCDEGCSPIREDKYIVSYPDAIITSEHSSAPIKNLLSSYIELACQPGYTISTGTVGYSYAECKKRTAGVDWNPTEENFIDCVRGCPDITGTVDNGITTDVPNTTPKEAPFKPGDTVTFSCDSGYVLVGYDILTCTGLLEWNENTPECVMV